MSADNTIFIRPMPDGTYCVAMLLSTFPGEDRTEKEVDELFRNKSSAKRVDTIGEAKAEAHAMYRDAVIVEYGIKFWPRSDQEMDPNHEVLKQASYITLGDYIYHVEDDTFYEVVELEKVSNDKIKVGIQTDDNIIRTKIDLGEKFRVQTNR